MQTQFIKNINNLSLTFCAFVVTFTLAVAAPVPAKFFVSTFNAEVGQTVEFELKVEGTDSAPVYTVIANLEYDKNLLSFKGATSQSGWVTVSPDDVTDTANGVIKRTAGYPSGLKQLGSIYKYSFTALAPGDAKVSILGSSAYDAENTDLGLQNKSITVKIGGKKEKIVEEEVTPKTTPKIEPKKEEVKTEDVVVKKPQTVSLQFAGQNGFDVKKDYSFVLKHNIAVAQETIGSSTIAVKDAAGNTLWRESKDFTFTDSSEVLITIPAGSLQAGNLILSVDTKHDNQKNSTTLSKELGAVEPEDRIVKEEKLVPYVPVYVYIVGAIMFVWYLLTLTYYKSKKFKKFLKNF